MTHRHNRKQWDDQELHKLFATRLPILAIPDDFAERLTLSVLEEVVRHVEQKIDPGADRELASLTTGVAAFDDCCAEASGSELASTTACAARRRRVPPAIL
jgi:hypothetical protein